MIFEITKKKVRLVSYIPFFFSRYTIYKEVKLRSKKKSNLKLKHQGKKKVKCFRERTKLFAQNFKKNSSLYIFLFVFVVSAVHAIKAHFNYLRVN